MYGDLFVTTYLLDRPQLHDYKMKLEGRPSWAVIAIIRIDKIRGKRIKLVVVSDIGKLGLSGLIFGRASTSLRSADVPMGQNVHPYLDIGTVYCH